MLTQLIKILTLFSFTICSQSFTYRDSGFIRQLATADYPRK